jgi:site-specific DNA recombinase
VQRVPAGDIEQAVVAQLSAVLRTPTLVAQTYFAARDIEQAEAKRLEQHLKDLEKALASVRQHAIDLMQPGVESADQGPHLLELNRRAVELTNQINTVKTARSAGNHQTLSEREIAEAFENIEGLWEDLFPVERHQLIRLLVASVEVREDSLELELKTQGVASVVTELAGLCCASTERRTAA